MSGPWDRPSRDPGGDWPTEDIEPPAAAPRAQPPDDPWASDDLWPEPPRDASPGWQDWPAQPADDELVAEEPPPPALSDPWAESWSDDSSMAPAPRETWDEPVADRAGANAPVESGSSDVAVPEPAPLRPWSPEPDPWGGTVEPRPEPEARSEPEGQLAPVAEPEVAPPPSPEPEAQAAHEPEMEAEAPPAEPPAPESGDASAGPPLAGAFRGLGRAARTVLPDWLAEPISSRSPARHEPDVDHASIEAPEVAADEPSRAEEPAETGEAARQPAPDPVPELEEPAPSVPEPDPEAPDQAPEAVASRPWWRAGGVWGSPSPTDRGALADAEAPEPEPGDEPAPEPEPEIEPTTREDPAVQEPGPPDDGDPAPVPDAAPAGPSWAAEPRDAWAAAPWGSAAPAEASPMDDAPPSAEPDEPPEPPELSGRTDAGEPRWDDPERPAVESTQVLPTSWAAPLPEARPTTDPRAPLAPVGGDIRTRLREEREADIDLDENGEPEPTTAEQAVPWLIGFILLLAGMVIVLLALIFAGDESLGGGGGASPTASTPIGLVSESASSLPSASVEPSPSPTATERPDPSDSPAPSVAPTPTPLALPEYGPLEIIYQGRSAALAPIYLLHREFTVEGQPEVLAQDPALDVRRFAWAPDGTVGVGLYEDVLVSVEIGTEKRRLGDGLSTVTFGDDAGTVYAVRVGQDGDNDVATVLAIDFASADTREVASVSYARPDVAVAESLTEAQFADDGGPLRLYWMEDDVLMLWAIGGGAWEISPDGEVTEVDDVAPVLWSPDRASRIDVVDGAQSTLRLLDGSDEVTAATMVGGLISHLRWSPSGDRVVFTVARSAAGGGILQDLFLWDLADGTAPTQLTATGAAFGAEWRGSQPRWAFE